MRSWQIKKTTYEGLLLLLRWPTNIEEQHLRAMFPILVVLFHEFKQTSPNGLPDADYNDGLMAMDCEITEAFDSRNHGLPVLVETFAGKRRYYFYVTLDADVEATFSPLAKRHSNENLSWTTRKDADWNFILNYRKTYLV